MAHMVKVIGVNEIKNKLRESSMRLAGSVRRGLMKGGLYLQRESQKIVPVETGNLKGSAGTKPIGRGWHTDVVVYYTATYAVYVHERTELSHKPGKEAKFLEKPAREQRKKILDIIAGEAENM